MSTIDLFKELGDIFKLQGEIIKMQANETPIETEKLEAPAPIEKASLIVMSHLSDAQESNIKPNSDLNINFAKFIIMWCKGDLTQEIDGDEMWEKYLNLSSTKI
jgi:hypothetical protein